MPSTASFTFGQNLTARAEPPPDDSAPGGEKTEEGKKSEGEPTDKTTDNDKEDSTPDPSLSG